MNFRNRNLIVTDIETTGLDSSIHDIIEIGSIKVNQDLEELDRFEVKIRVQNPETVTIRAVEVNGYSEENWKNATSLFLAMDSFSKFSEEGILSSWNTTFEYRFLNESFRRANIADLMDYHRIDIPSIVWFMSPTLQKLSLDLAAQHFGLLPEPKPHRAIIGAEYALNILRMLRKKHG